MKSSQAGQTLGKRLLRILGNAGGYLLGLAILGVLGVLGSETVRTMPDHAIVLVDTQAHVYHGIPNADVCGDESMSLMTAREARDLGYEPCPRCREDGLFAGRTCSAIRALAEDYLRFPRGRERWNDDGPWNW